MYPRAAEEERAKLSDLTRCAEKHCELPEVVLTFIEAVYLDSPEVILKFTEAVYETIRTSRILQIEASSPLAPKGELASFCSPTGARALI